MVDHKNIFGKGPNCLFEISHPYSQFVRYVSPSIEQYLKDFSQEKLVERGKKTQLRLLSTTDDKVNI